MKILLKNNIFDIDNIYLNYNYQYNFNKIEYQLPYITITGLPINIHYYKKFFKNGLIYLYLNNFNDLNLLNKIETKTKSNIIKYNRYEKSNYIIVKDPKNNILNNKPYNMNISINKIKSINNCYVAIINII